MIAAEPRVQGDVAAVKVIADETSRSMTQVALAWLRQRSVAVFPIVGV